MFFVIDGVDGAGKSTQIDLLTECLRSLGKDVVQCRDPGGTELGNNVRELLLNNKDIDIDPVTEMFLFMSSRSQMVRQVIMPAIESGKTVVCDRFLMATIVYQGHAGRVNIDDIRQVGQVATAGLKANHTFVLDLPAETALARIDRGFDRMESKGIDFMNDVRAGFQTETKHDPESCTLIDATQSIELVALTIRKTVQALIGS